jgi:hypothetical protein
VRGKHLSSLGGTNGQSPIRSPRAGVGPTTPYRVHLSTLPGRPRHLLPHVHCTRVCAVACRVVEDDVQNHQPRLPRGMGSVSTLREFDLTPGFEEKIILSSIKLGHIGHCPCIVHNAFKSISAKETLPRRPPYGYTSRKSTTCLRVSSGNKLCARPLKSFSLGSYSSFGRIAREVQNWTNRRSRSRHA